MKQSKPTLVVVDVGGRKLTEDQLSTEMYSRACDAVFRTLHPDLVTEGDGLKHTSSEARAVALAVLQAVSDLVNVEAKAKGDGSYSVEFMVKVNDPEQPGRTLSFPIQIAFNMPESSPSITINNVMPSSRVVIDRDASGNVIGAHPVE